MNASIRNLALGILNKIEKAKNIRCECKLPLLRGQFCPAERAQDEALTARLCGADRLAKIVLELEGGLSRIASLEDGPNLVDVNYYMQQDIGPMSEIMADDVRTARECIARAQQIVSEVIV